MLRNIDALEYEDWLLLELYYAYLEARRGKRNTADEYKFEINWFENLVNLRDGIVSRSYRPSRGIAFITRRPVVREIFAAPFRDRVVHHFLCDLVMDWWDDHLQPDSYSCRIQKGTLYGIRRLQKRIWNISEGYKQPTYVALLDIQGYFMSLKRELLFERAMWGANRQFAGNKPMLDLVQFLWEQIIFDDPIKDVTKRGRSSDWDLLPASKSLFNQPSGQGIVIGNLTSQLLSNVYLDQLDRFVRYNLGYEAYGRYVDDFYIVAPASQLNKLQRDITAIEKYLRSIGLTLHPKKRKIVDVNKGVPFLGAVIYPGHTVPSKRFKKNFYETAEAVMMGRKGPESIVSYLGHGKHMNSSRLEMRIFEKMGWVYRF